MQSCFLKRYNLSLKVGKNERDAFLHAITFFRYKKPFSDLTDEDIKRLHETSNPVLVARLFGECSKSKNLKVIRKL